MTVAVTRRRKRNSNWEEEFYRNGYPREVIVIDSPTPPPPPTAPTLLPPLTAPTTYSSSSSRPPINENGGVLPSPYSGLTESPARHISSVRRGKREDIPGTKRRKMDMHAGRTVGGGATYYPCYAGGDCVDCASGIARHEEVSYREIYPPPPPLPPPSAVTRTLPPGQPAYDDKDGHYIVIPDDDLTPRYRIIRQLGQGTFGKVVECWDRVTRTYCAIKIIRAIQKYRDASKIEIRVLNTLKDKDPLNLNKCIHLRECFDFRNHICMVFDLLGQSVFDFLKENGFAPFPPDQIQDFAKQLLTSVAFLHDLHLIHTDLKPENILLVNGEYKMVSSRRHPSKMQRVLLDTEIRLIDFGSATFESEYHSSVVSTRHYRAPEVILGMGWSYPCDIWSIGCILVELYTGDALFQTHDNLEHLAMMEAVLGRMGERMVRQASKQYQKYFRGGRLDYPNEETNRQSRKYVKAMRPLHEIVPPTSALNELFLNLLRKLLVYDPVERITAREALRHPYFFAQAN
ncbi:uncharacterized protein VTP21DRAFT_8440 [Calcarisporiella thermophila]|uniref:uncharacterized protein n=1 Tax=Calcarisporiella thermophila TaxID=911321 RepID=UPI0037446CC9